MSDRPYLHGTKADDPIGGRSGKGEVKWMGANGRRTADDFSWNNIARMTTGVYEEILR